MAVTRALWVARKFYSTSKTEFIAPQKLVTWCRALGSGLHWPSTRNRYSYRPAGSRIGRHHFPARSWRRGLAWGFQSLKLPATQTEVASGAKNLNLTWRSFPAAGRANALLLALRNRVRTALPRREVLRCFTGTLTTARRRPFLFADFSILILTINTSFNQDACRVAPRSIRLDGLPL
jgi:hypothetical protein